MPQIVWAARADGSLDYFNERWYVFVGSRPETEEDADWQRLLHVEDVDRFNERWRTSVASGEPFEIEVRLFDAARSQHCWFLGRALPVRDKSGDIIRWYGTFTDIDHQKNLLEELRRANEDLNQFAYSASHDLKEPLRTIAVYTQLLERKLRSTIDSETESYLRQVLDGSHRMEALLRDLLAYTDAAKIQPDDAPLTDANISLRKAMANLRVVFEESGAKVDAAQLPRVRAREIHLVQLFQNLLENAIKYRTSEPPRIRIEVKSWSGEWVFSVADNGIGIAPRYHTHIFSLFKRLHSRAHSPGTGMGLAICKRIVERYGGRIWVQSEEGKGSVFLFTFPMDPAD